MRQNQQQAKTDTLGRKRMEAQILKQQQSETKAQDGKQQMTMKRPNPGQRVSLVHDLNVSLSTMHRRKEGGLPFADLV